MPQDVRRIEWWKSLRERGPDHRNPRLVLLVLSTWMDPDGGSCYPTQLSIAQAATLNVKTVQRLLKRANATGWIRTWQTNAGNHSWRRTHYHATLPTTDHKEADKPRPPEATFKRDARGRFTNVPAGQTATPPSHSGVREPLPHQVREVFEKKSSPSSDSNSQLKRTVVRLAEAGRTPAEIAGILFQYEVGEPQIAQWIREASVSTVRSPRGGTA
jgi:hypothetical protein